ncbi:MAG: hypothetical protein JXX28_12460 [Deltaproteobacteria bacterium]|nr:hypothetical protein [Deltaproteobacteria bacterium]
MRAGALALLLWGGVALADAPERIAATAPSPEVSVERWDGPDLQTERPDGGFVITRIRARPVAFSGQGLHPGAMAAYLAWRRSGPRLDSLEAEQRALLETLTALLRPYHLAGVPEERLPLLPGLPLLLDATLTPLTGELSQTVDLTAPGAFATEHAGEEGGLLALERWLQERWLAPVRLEVEVRRIERQAAADTLSRILEGAPRPLTASEHLLLTEFHYDRATRGASGALELGPVVSTCERFLDTFGPDHQVAPEILHLLAWALMEPRSTVYDPAKGQAVLRTLLDSTATGELVEQARFLLAEARFEEGAVEEALTLYQPLAADPASPWYQAARYKGAWCQQRLGRYQDAAGAFATLALDAPLEAVRTESLRTLARAQVDLAWERDVQVLTLLEGWEGPPALLPPLWAETAEATEGAGELEQAIALQEGLLRRWPLTADGPAKWVRVADLIQQTASPDPAQLQAARRQVLALTEPDHPWWLKAGPAERAQALIARRTATKGLAEAARQAGGPPADRIALLTDLQRRSPDALGDGAVALQLSIALAEAARIPEALNALRATADMPERLRCTAWELELRLESTLVPGEPPPSTWQVARLYADRCVQAPADGLATMPLVSELTAADWTGPALTLLAAAWEPWLLSPEHQDLARPLLKELGPLDPMGTLDLCLDTHQVSWRWSGCAQARKEVGRSVLTGRRWRILHTRSR